MADFGRMKGSRSIYFPPARRLAVSSQYSLTEHDDRCDDRIVKLKGGDRRRSFRSRSRPGGSSRLGIDNEGDVAMGGGDMDSGPKHRRMAPYMPSRRARANRHRSAPPKHSHPAKNSIKEGGWYRIVIPNGDKWDKDFVLNSIATYCDVPFVPYQYNNDGKFAVFYVESPEIAYAIEKVSMRVQGPSGFKMKIIPYPNHQPPPLSLNEGVLQKIKLAMSKRFTVETGRLDLSRFHLDPELKSQGLFVLLQRTNILLNIMKIVEDNIPELQVLDLSANKIAALDPLKSLASRVKGIKVVVLKNNNLRKIEELDHIKDLQLDELVLDGNPLCDHFTDQTAYVSAVRQRFPKIQRLDGQELPPSYGFGLDTETILPTSQGSFFTNDKSREVVPEFLKQYYGIYDSSDRQPLLDAYHDQAFFSLSASGSKMGSSWKSLAPYQMGSRNLINVNNTGRRTKLLRQGKLGVVSFLCSLPKTAHDPASFSIDVVHSSPALLAFSCSGVFRETDSRTPNPPIRSFSRSFVLIPQGSGYCIVNELLYITNATSDQVKVAFKVPAPTPSPSPVPPPVAPVVIPTAEQQQQMVLAFCTQSRMNSSWSLKCLQENDWDFEKAAAVFQQFHSEGKIPPQAFEPILQV